MTRGTPLPSLPSPPLPSLPSLPLVTQRIHSPFQPKQSPSVRSCMSSNLGSQAKVGHTHSLYKYPYEVLRARIQCSLVIVSPSPANSANINWMRDSKTLSRDWNKFHCIMLSISHAHRCYLATACLFSCMLRRPDSGTFLLPDIHISFRFLLPCPMFSTMHLVNRANLICQTVFPVAPSITPVKLLSDVITHISPLRVSSSSVSPSSATCSPFFPPQPSPAIFSFVNYIICFGSSINATSRHSLHVTSK